MEVNRNMVNKYDEDILQLKIDIKNTKDQLGKQIMEGRIYQLELINNNKKEYDEFIHEYKTREYIQDIDKLLVEQEYQQTIINIEATMYQISRKIQKGNEEQ